MNVCLKDEPVTLSEVHGPVRGVAENAVPIQPNRGASIRLSITETPHKAKDGVTY